MTVTSHWLVGWGCLSGTVLVQHVKRERVSPQPKSQGQKETGKKTPGKPAILFNLNIFMFEYLHVPVLLNRTDELQIMKDI